ncbi:hypothetical protein PsorP6_018643 [Peronosclerospora sorghi]|nr:hypothetical protein PsorP6_018643 [Peronosclerospora sorghi]
MKEDYKKREKLQHLVADRLMLKYDGEGGARQIDTEDESIEAKSDYGGGHGFNAEYFDTDDDWLDEHDSQMEDGRGSYHTATREGHLTEQHGAEEGNGQGKTRQRGCELPVAKTNECQAGEKGSNAYGQDAGDHIGLYGHNLVVRIVERRTNGGGYGTEKKERHTHVNFIVSKLFVYFWYH